MFMRTAQTLSLVFVVTLLFPLAAQAGKGTSTMTVSQEGQTLKMRGQALVYSDQLFTIQNAKGIGVPFTLTKETKVLRGGATVALKTIKTFSPVDVIYTSAPGGFLAKEIHILK